MLSFIRKQIVIRLQFNCNLNKIKLERIYVFSVCRMMKCFDLIYGVKPFVNQM